MAAHILQEGAPVRTPRASIMRTPRDGAAVPSDGVPSSPAAPQQRRERTKSVVWKDAPPPKGTPKGAEKPELSTVVTYAREPGTNARKVVRPFDRAVAHHSCPCDATVSKPARSTAPDSAPLTFSCARPAVPLCVFDWICSRAKPNHPSQNIERASARRSTASSS